MPPLRPLSIKLTAAEIDLRRRLAEHLGVSLSTVLRLGMRRLAELENVPISKPAGRESECAET